MKSLSTIRLVLALIGVSGLFLLAGCSTMLPPTLGGYEYRYRIFEAKEPMPSELDAPVSSEMLAERFLPAQGLNRAMDVLAQDGFTLYKMQAVPGTDHVTFTFRRPMPRNARPQRAPRDFTGTYQVQAPGDTTIFYAFSPIYDGYTVVRFHGTETPQVFDTTWDENQLVLKDDNICHAFTLSGDGLAVVHQQDRFLSQGLDRKVYTAHRIQTGKP